MNELEVAFAFIARREGRRAMPASRWAMVLSLDLGWMPPAAAQAFVARGIENALLRPAGDELQFTVDPATVEIPRGFRPGTQPAPTIPPPASTAPAVAPAPQVDPFLDWVDRLATHTKVERRQVLDQVAAVQARMGGQLTAIAALLWLAARAGLDVREAAAKVKV